MSNLKQGDKVVVLSGQGAGCEAYVESVRAPMFTDGKLLRNEKIVVLARLTTRRARAG